MTLLLIVGIIVGTMSSGLKSAACYWSKEKERGELGRECYTYLTGAIKLAPFSACVNRSSNSIQQVPSKSRDYFLFFLFDPIRTE